MAMGMMRGRKCICCETDLSGTEGYIIFKGKLICDECRQELKEKTQEG